MWRLHDFVPGEEDRSVGGMQSSREVREVAGQDGTWLRAGGRTRGCNRVVYIAPGGWECRLAGSQNGSAGSCAGRKGGGQRVGRRV